MAGFELPLFSLILVFALTRLHTLVASLDLSLLRVSVCVWGTVFISVDGLVVVWMPVCSLTSWRVSRNACPASLCWRFARETFKRFAAKSSAGQTGVSLRPAWLYLSELWSHSATCISDDTAAMPVNVSQHHNIKAVTDSDERFRRASAW